MIGNRSHDDWPDDDDVPAIVEVFDYQDFSLGDGEDVEPDGGDQDDDEQSDGVVFQVSNPQGSVTVSAYISGRVANVDLSSAVSRMTERELAEEIKVLSDLARDQARAGQHAFVTTIMTGLGHDPVYTNGFLRRQIGLPTPDDANDEKARVFATRYYEAGRDCD